MGGDYGSVGWLCDSVGGGSTVMQAEKGGKNVQAILQVGIHGVGL